MRMTAYKKVRFLHFKDVFHLGHVMVRVTADVGHEDVDIFDVEIEVLGILHSDDVVVHVAVYGSQRLEGGQSLSRLNAADVARMPQLIHVLEEVEELWYEGTMGVGKDADFKHNYFKLIMKPMARTSLNCTFEPSILTPSAS